MKYGALLIAAAAAFAQPKPVAGTVADFRGAMELVVRTDSGPTASVKFSPDTQVLRVPPGERDLSKAKPAEATGILLGDRILASYVEGMKEARRIIVITADEITRRNEKERLDWSKRGFSGTVVAMNSNEITIEARTPMGPATTVVALTSDTRVRRYAPDSVKFTEALPSSAAEIAMGDQFRTRGNKSADSKLIAEDVVFGTFLTKIGTVLSIDAGGRRIRIQDLATGVPLTIKLIADSKIKVMPQMREMRSAPAGSSHDAPPPGATQAFDPIKLVEQLPVARLDEIKVGSGVVVTSTRGSKPDEVTAITLIGNSDALIQMAQSAAAGKKGVTVMDALGQMHGGMLSGPSGFSLPAMIP